jgi:hypothetical protein
VGPRRLAAARVRPDGEKTGQVFRVIYDDDLRFVGEEMADRAEMDTLPSNELLQAVSVPAVLASRVTCAACGAKMGTARRCRTCGAPAPEHPPDLAPGTEPGRQGAPKWARAIAWIGGILLNIVALWIAIGFVVIAIIEGSSGRPSARTERC